MAESSSPRLPAKKFLTQVREPTVGNYLYTVFKWDAPRELFDEAYFEIAEHPECNIIIERIDNVELFVYEYPHAKDVLEVAKHPKWNGLRIVRGPSKIEPAPPIIKTESA